MPIEGEEVRDSRLHGPRPPDSEGEFVVVGVDVVLECHLNVDGMLPIDIVWQGSREVEVFLLAWSEVDRQGLCNRWFIVDNSFHVDLVNRGHGAIAQGQHDVPIGGQGQPHDGDVHRLGGQDVDSVILRLPTMLFAMHVGGQIGNIVSRNDADMVLPRLHGRRQRHGDSQRALLIGRGGRGDHLAELGGIFELIVPVGPGYHLDLLIVEFSYGFPVPSDHEVELALVDALVDGEGDITVEAGVARTWVVHIV